MLFKKRKIEEQELSAGKASRDVYFEEAGGFIVDRNKASIGMLQRIFKISFKRASIIMDQLCEAGVVGPEEGTRPREILMTRKEYDKFIEALNDLEESVDVSEEQTVIETFDSSYEYDLAILQTVGLNTTLNRAYTKRIGNSFPEHLLIPSASIKTVQEVLRILINHLLPESVRLLVIASDPISLSFCNGFPQMLISVVINPNKYDSVINWLVTEMNDRFNLLLNSSKKNINEYNDAADNGKSGLIPLPHILLLVEEIDDICNSDTNEALTRLLLNGIIVGIHIICFSRYSEKNIALGKKRDLFQIMREGKMLDLVSLNNSRSNQKSNTDFDSMTGLEFENFCTILLKYNGFSEVVQTPGSSDQGIDIIAYKDDIKYGIQCKCYSSDVGNSAVQEVLSGKTYYECHVGVVLTNRDFTNSAKELAKKSGIILWNRKKLLKLIEQTEVS